MDVLELPAPALQQTRRLMALTVWWGQTQLCASACVGADKYPLRPDHSQRGHRQRGLPQVMEQIPLSNIFSSVPKCTVMLLPFCRSVSFCLSVHVV